MYSTGTLSITKDSKMHTLKKGGIYWKKETNFEDGSTRYHNQESTFLILILWIPSSCW